MSSLLVNSKAEFIALEQLRALLKSEGIAFEDTDAALKSIAGTVLPTKLKVIYLKEMERMKA